MAKTASQANFKRRSRRFARLETLESRRLLAGLVNGDFSTGDLSGWTVYQTENGVVGEVRVEDVPGAQPSLSQAATFQVGEVEWQRIGGGGGIYQTFESNGPISLSADLASFNPPSDPDNVNPNSFNYAGGLVRMLVDGEEVARHNFGRIYSNVTESASLRGTVELQAGLHEVRFEITRPYHRADYTPLQYVDNVFASDLNRAPIARDDSADIDEGGSTAIHVLLNDADPDGEIRPSSLEIVEAPGGGVVSIDSEGIVHYEANPGFSGIDRFTYAVRDNYGATSTAEVTINVRPVIDGNIVAGNGKSIVDVNLRSNGPTQIALLSTDGADSFDATAVDLALLELSSQGKAIDFSKARLRDVDHDGKLDLVLHLNTNDLAEVLDASSISLDLNVEFGGSALGVDYRGSVPVKVKASKQR